MTSTEPTEFALIARLTADLATTSAVVQGVGDDAAILDWQAGLQLVATCDVLVEGRHFLRERATANEIGRRALAVNLSDIAAMGGEARFALVSLVLPTATDATWLDGLYRGLRAQADEFDVSLVGGNIAATDGPLVVDVTVLGQVARGKAILRSGARAGDRLCVTGEVGSAAAGLLVLLKPPATHQGALAPALRHVHAAQIAPRPRLREGHALAQAGGVTAMIDISDGLAADLGHVCERSHVGAVVEATALPIAPETIAIAQLYKRDAHDLALFGGEDYELLFTVPPEAADRALDAVRAAGGTARAIGWIVEAVPGTEPDMRLRLPDGSERPLPARGWDHLRAASI